QGGHELGRARLRLGGQRRRQRGQRRGRDRAGAGERGGRRNRGRNRARNWGRNWGRNRRRRGGRRGEIGLVGVDGLELGVGGHVGRRRTGEVLVGRVLARAAERRPGLAAARNHRLVAGVDHQDRRARPVGGIARGLDRGGVDPQRLQLGLDRREGALDR